MYFAKYFLLSRSTVNGSWQIKFWTRQETPICSVDTGSVFSMQSTFPFLPGHLSTLYLTPSDYLTTTHKKSIPDCLPLLPVIALLSVSYISPSTACELSSKPSLFSSFLFFVTVMWWFDLMEISPQKTGYVPPVTFFTCIFRPPIKRTVACKIIFYL